MLKLLNGIGRIMQRLKLSKETVKKIWSIVRILWPIVRSIMNNETINVNFQVLGFYIQLRAGKRQSGQAQSINLKNQASLKNIIDQIHLFRIRLELRTLYVSLIISREALDSAEAK